MGLLSNEYRAPTTVQQDDTMTMKLDVSDDEGRNVKLDTHNSTMTAQDQLKREIEAEDQKRFETEQSRNTGKQGNNSKQGSVQDSLRHRAQQRSKERQNNGTAYSLQSRQRNDYNKHRYGSKDDGSIGSRGTRDCPKCHGNSYQLCEDFVDQIRKEFTDHIELLFRKKMQEFVDFIEEVIDVEDQIDVDKDHVIHAFYRKHNSLQKINENFRLLEYKRKKYI